MAVGRGTRLGHYTIVSPLGAGGMGEVWLAEDATLKRQVAIKVLPPSLAADPNRLARFQREAEVLASLNHPNIAHIHGLEDADGGKALVMELVEGEDLSRRIARGAMPLDEALPIGKQIADALEAAHEHRIIHRDLKPANIKVRPDGTVKVLDFGLAKALAPEGAGATADAMNSPTITTPRAMTQAGMILGTAAYMSPEQARGKTVDERADIWAFGVVLYEMLTGKRPFDGEDMTEVLGAVVRLEPNFDALPSDVPARIRRVLQLCLRKDLRQRVQAMGDVRLALEGAFEVTVPQAATVARSRSRGAPLAWIVAAAAVLAAVALAIPTVWYLRQTPPPEMRLEIVTPATDAPTSFALSPDGRQIVFVASGDGTARLWLRSLATTTAQPLATTTAQPLAGTEGATHPFWKPDSRSIGFFASGALKRIDLGGGAPRTVATASAGRGGTWNADDIILFTPNTGSPLFRVPASAGTPVVVTTLDRQNSHRLPSFLPDGRHFLFYTHGTPDTTGIYLGALDAPGMRRLTAADAAGVYLPAGPRPAEAFRGGGWLLWVRAGTLVAQRLDLDRQALTGDQVTLADPVVVDANLSVAAVSTPAGGLVAYRTGGGSRRQLAWVDQSGKALGPLGAPDENALAGPRVSPDGRRVAVSRTVQGNTDIWLLDGMRPRRLTFDSAEDLSPVWSPDGSRIVFTSNRTGVYNLYQKLASGAGAEDLLLASPQFKGPTDWSADGRFLLYQINDPQTGWDLWVLPMEGDRTPWVFLKTPFNERSGKLSPNRRWVAYGSDESESSEIYIRPFGGPFDVAQDGSAGSGAANAAGGGTRVSTAGGVNPRWRHDSKELYYVNPAGGLMAAPITVTGSTVAPGTPVALFSMRLVGGRVDGAKGQQYDVTRDGHFLIDTVLGDASAPITLLQNWHPPAKK